MLNIQIKKKDEASLKVKFDARKTVDGSILIFDHPDVDIIVSPGNNKLIVFGKEDLTDEIYDTQDRLFKFMVRSGAILPDSVQGSNIAGSLEGRFAVESDWTEPMQFVLYSLSQFFDKDIPKQEFVDDILQKEKDMVTDPTVDDTTELGEVPHAPEKGALKVQYNSWGNAIPYRAW